jgi:plasmid stabilization system protein ParE
VPQIVWLPEAVEDAKCLFDFLADKSSDATARAAQAIQKGANTLTDFPELGRPMNDGTGRRELLIPFGAGSYVLRYIIDAETVVIIRVWHSREYRE